MARIRLSRELVNDGLGPTELASLVRRGQLVRVRRGAYCEPAAQGDDRSVAHRLLMAATVRQVSPEAVISHESAAVLHGLPTWGDLSRVELTRDRAGGV